MKLKQNYYNTSGDKTQIIKMFSSSLSYVNHYCHHHHHPHHPAGKGFVAFGRVKKFEQS
jgi:hypothetical protein